MPDGRRRSGGIEASREEAREMSSEAPDGTSAITLAATLAAVAGSNVTVPGRVSLLGLHGTAASGLVVTSNQWFAPLLLDKPLSDWSRTRVAVVVGRLRRERAVATGGRPVHTLRDLFHALEALATLGHSVDPFAFVAGLLYRPAAAVQEAAKRARETVLSRPLLTIHLRSGVLFQDMNKYLRSHASTHERTRLNRGEMERRMAAAVSCATRRVIESLGVTRDLQGAPKAAQVLILGDSDLNSEKLARALRSALFGRPPADDDIGARGFDWGSREPLNVSVVTIATPALAAARSMLAADPRLCTAGVGRVGGSGRKRGEGESAAASAALALLDQMLIGDGEQCLFTPRSTFGDVAAARTPFACSLLARSFPRASAVSSATRSVTEYSTLGAPTRVSLATCLPVTWRSLGHLACLAEPWTAQGDKGSTTGSDIGGETGREATNPSCLCADPTKAGRNHYSNVLTRMTRHFPQLVTELATSKGVGRCPPAAGCRMLLETAGSFVVNGTDAAETIRRCQLLGSVQGPANE